MASLNFYQDYGTGAPLYSADYLIFYTGSLYDPNTWGVFTPVWYGPILPTSDGFFTCYTGYWLPESVIQGYSQGFRLSILDDQDRYMPSIRLGISGAVNEQPKDNALFTVTFSGNVAPLVSESGIFSINITGEMSSGKNDESIYNLNLTGSAYKVDGDTGYLDVNMTGYYQSVPRDDLSYRTSIAGANTSGRKDIMNLSTVVSGSVTKKDKDICSIEFRISGVSFDIGGKYLTGYIFDQTDINLAMTQVIYERV